MTRSVAGMFLAPGAGGAADDPALLAVERAVAPLAVRRTKLPAGAGAIPAVLREAAALARQLRTEPGALVLGGRSFGGRMCSMALAQGLPAAGLVLLSYPMHPPGRPDQWRSAHLADLRMPVLAISGDRDPYGSPDELRAGLPPHAELVLVGGGHRPADQESLARTVAEWVARLG